MPSKSCEQFQSNDMVSRAEVKWKSPPEFSACGLDSSGKENRQQAPKLGFPQSSVSEVSHGLHRKQWPGAVQSIDNGHAWTGWNREERLRDTSDFKTRIIGNIQISMSIKVWNPIGLMPPAANSAAALLQESCASAGIEDRLKTMIVGKRSLPLWDWENFVEISTPMPTGTTSNTGLPEMWHPSDGEHPCWGCAQHTTMFQRNALFPST